jgi:hypothetical protein
VKKSDGVALTERPGVWFGLLYRALEEQDFVKAGEAQVNLRRLGVVVRFQRFPRRSSDSASQEELPREEVARI